MIQNLPVSQHFAGSLHSRRAMLLLSGCAVAFTAQSALGNEMPTAAALVTIEDFSVSGESLGSVQTPKVVKSDAQWRAQLTAEQFAVTRQAATEAAFGGAYWNNGADGLYRCVGCETCLFDSRTKFESKTGWPSFYRPISSENVTRAADDSDGMHRTAVSCALCDAHLGHVFHDGPRPTGLRYCMNSAALHFVPRSS